MKPKNAYILGRSDYYLVGKGLLEIESMRKYVSVIRWCNICQYRIFCHRYQKTILYTRPWLFDSIWTTSLSLITSDTTHLMQGINGTCCMVIYIYSSQHIYFAL